MESCMIRLKFQRWFAFFGLAALLASTHDLSAATRSKKGPVVPKWGLLDQSFKSSAHYTNPVQQATLLVTFVSPDHQTNIVEGFWDGGKTWRVRFCPDTVGQWQYYSACSDASNLGLNDRAGEFICTSVTGPTRFNQHGPVRVAKDRRHFEHADGTPFFWIADTVWDGPRLAQGKDWEYYAGTRGLQKFTVAQWSVFPGIDAKKEAGWKGDPDSISINPDFFRRLDDRIDMLGRAGILNAIAPFMELPSRAVANPLREDQAALLIRYAVARWGSYPVAWLVACGGDSQAKNVGRWKRIGLAAFSNGIDHAPVVLYPGETTWIFNEFRDQPWVDAFAYSAVTDQSDDALKLAVAGPFANEWKQPPARVLISVAPLENSVAPESKKRFTAQEIRRGIYWGELMTVPAGASYGAQGVVEWDTSFDPAAKSKEDRLPIWRKSLFLPGAKQMAHVASVFQGVQFWRLRPEPRYVPDQPGQSAPSRFIAAAGTDAKDLSLVYVPEDRTVEIAVEALPASPSVSWFNPRDGQTSPAVAVVGARTCQFPTPDQGDWLLMMKAGK